MIYMQSSQLNNGGDFSSNLFNSRRFDSDLTSTTTLITHIRYNKTNLRLSGSMLIKVPSITQKVN